MADDWRNYWVLLVDIMGFSERIQRADEGKRLVEKYREVIDHVLTSSSQLTTLRTNRLYDAMFDRIRAGGGQARDAPSLESRRDASSAERQEKDQWQRRIHVFSDTMIFFFDPVSQGDSLGTSPTDAYWLGSMAADLSRELWKQHLPHRGAAAFGECYCSADEMIFAGGPIVKATKWEKAQLWLGISVEPSSLGAARTDLGRNDLDSFEEVALPSRNGPVLTWAVNPFSDFVSPSRATAAPPDPALDGFLAEYRRAEAAGLLEVIPKYVETARRFLAFNDRPPDASRLNEVAGR